MTTDNLQSIKDFITKLNSLTLDNPTDIVIRDIFVEMSEAYISDGEDWGDGDEDIVETIISNVIDEAHDLAYEAFDSEIPFAIFLNKHGLLSKYYKLYFKGYLLK